MFDSILASESVQEALSILQTEFPLAIWETFYVTVLSTLFASIIGLRRTCYSRRQRWYSAASEMVDGGS